MSAIPNELPVVLPDALPDRAMPAPVLRTLVICDLADSTALVEKLGDQRGAEVMRQHDRLARDLVESHHGREIDKTDGFLILFERPIHAVAFALDYQRELRALSETESLPLAARIGIHVGDVVIWDNNAHDVARGAKPVEVEGLVKPTAARIMSIARPGQILLSSMASTLAQRARSELGSGADVRWQTHGNYRFKGMPEPVQVHEVGEEGIAPFRAPAWTGKAHREIPWWRRPGMLFVEAAVVITAIAVPAYFSLRSPAAIAFAERDWVVVGDLRNQTGQGVLDDSLDTAFRVSLEQSRFVNLVSSLQVNDALKRMQKPGGTKIDREIGSEIAIREGARALILPTVAEVGGRVRVTAEVVDPHTQATVYAETADGTGLDSILPSVGKVSGELRGRLGEAVASIEANNAPLPKVTTSNLDALRSYSLGLQAYRKARYSDALALYQQAVKLDPDFALAYMGMARIYEGSEDAQAAKQATAKALALKDRLSARDQLYLDAWSGRWGAPGPMLKKWQLLGQVYPDYFAAAYNYAYFVWHLENRAKEAIQAIQPALSEHDPLRAGAYNTLAFFQIAENQFEAAEKNFSIGTALGDHRTLGAQIALYAAQRRFEDAEKLLSQTKPLGFPTADLFASLEKVTLDLDKGDWQTARESSEEVLRTASKIGPLQGRIVSGTQLAIDDRLAPRAAQLAALRTFIAGVRAAVDDKADANHADNVFTLLFGAYLAVRAGDYSLAQSALEAASPYIHDGSLPNSEHMLAIVEAELMVREQKPQEAIARLKPTLDGSELYLTHVALTDSYMLAGRYEDALREATWLTAHRGRAYMETNSFHMLQAYNVAESNLALLRMAEIYTKMGNKEGQKKSLASFLASWPNASRLTFVSPRLAALEKP